MPNKLSIGNTLSQLNLESETIHKSIWKSLRFRKQGYFHTPQYQKFIKSKGKRGWDCYVDFFDKEKGTFPTGLLPDIVSTISKLGLSVDVEDQRTSKIKTEEITEDYLFDYNDRNGNPIVLYDYQYELPNKGWRYERGIFIAPTSAGKTLTFIAMIKSLPENTPVLILVRSKTLANQTYEELKKFGVENVGIVHGEKKEFNYIQICTIQSIEHIKPLLDKYEVLIVDEIHQFATNISISVFKKLKKCRYRFGFSASPWNPGDDLQKYRLKSWFGPILGHIKTAELKDRKILSDCTCYFHKITKPDDLYTLNYKEAYKKGVIQNEFLSNKIKSIIDSYQNGRILIVVENLEHGDILSQMIPGSIWVSGKDDDETRQYVIGKLSRSEPGEKVVGIATRILQTGINLFLHSLINAAGYKSYIMTIQRIGRGLRTALDKEKLDYHDFLYENNDYLEHHARQRIKFLTSEGHEIIVKD